MIRAVSVCIVAVTLAAAAAAATGATSPGDRTAAVGSLARYSLPVQDAESFAWVNDRTLLVCRRPVIGSLGYRTLLFYDLHAREHRELPLLTRAFDPDVEGVAPLSPWFHRGEWESGIPVRARPLSTSGPRSQFVGVSPDGRRVLWLSTEYSPMSGVVADMAGRIESHAAVGATGAILGIADPMPNPVGWVDGRHWAELGVFAPFGRSPARRSDANATIHDVRWSAPAGELRLPDLRSIRSARVLFAFGSGRAWADQSGWSDTGPLTSLRVREYAVGRRPRAAKELSWATPAFGVVTALAVSRDGNGFAWWVAGRPDTSGRPESAGLDGLWIASRNQRAVREVAALPGQADEAYGKSSPHLEWSADGKRLGVLRDGKLYVLDSSAGL